jgi:hypothetical protein
MVRQTGEPKNVQLQLKNHQAVVTIWPSVFPSTFNSLSAIAEALIMTQSQTLTVQAPCKHSDANEKLYETPITKVDAQATLPETSNQFGETGAEGSPATPDTMRASGEHNEFKALKYHQSRRKSHPYHKAFYTETGRKDVLQGVEIKIPSLRTLVNGQRTDSQNFSLQPVFRAPEEQSMAKPSSFVVHIESGVAESQSDQTLHDR